MNFYRKFATQTTAIFLSRISTPWTKQKKTITKMLFTSFSLQLRTEHKNLIAIEITMFIFGWTWTVQQESLAWHSIFFTLEKHFWQLKMSVDRFLFRQAIIRLMIRHENFGEYKKEKLKYFYSRASTAMCLPISHLSDYMSDSINVYS